jgi:RNA polymerase sigma-70 factor (ECF subfamily)
MSASHSNSPDGFLSVETLRRFCANDPAAFADVHQAFNGRLFAFVRVQFPNLTVEDAEDTVQELWAEIYRSRERFNPQDGHRGFSGWVYQKARQRSLDRVRKQPRAPLATDPEQLARQSQQASPAADQLQRTTELQQFHDCLQTLPADWRRLIVGKYLDEKSTAELAAQEQLPRNTVYTRLFRGKQQLQDCIDSKQHTKPPAGPSAS